MANPYDSKFWDAEEGLLWSALLGVFVAALMDGVEGGVALLPSQLTPLVNFDNINQAAIDYARSYRYDLIKGITDTTRTQVQSALTDWIKSNQPLKDLETQLRPIFGKVRAQMIAITEVTRVFAEGNTAAWRSTGFVSKRQWMTARDDRVCPICAPRDGKEFDIRDAGLMPAHPRCRCWWQPVLDVDAVNREFERIFK